MYPNSERKIFEYSLTHKIITCVFIFWTFISLISIIVGLIFSLFFDKYAYIIGIAVLCLIGLNVIFFISYRFYICYITNNEFEIENENEI